MLGLKLNHVSTRGPSCGCRALKTVSCCDANLAFTSGTEGCQNDNLWCNHWRQSGHDGNSRCQWLNVTFIVIHLSQIFLAFKMAWHTSYVMACTPSRHENRPTMLIHWNWFFYVFILTKFLSATLELVKIWQLLVQPVMKLSSKWIHIYASVWRLRS